MCSNPCFKSVGSLCKKRSCLITPKSISWLNEELWNHKELAWATSRTRCAGADGLTPTEFRSQHYGFRLGLDEDIEDTRAISCSSLSFASSLHPFPSSLWQVLQTAVLYYCQFKANGWSCQIFIWFRFFCFLHIVWS